MFRLKLAVLIATLLSAGALPARGEVSVLPPDVVASDTVAVIRADAAHFNPDKLQAAMTALLGDDAKGIKEMDEPMKKFKDLFNKATDAGIDAMTMVIGAPKKDDPDGRRGNGVLYITLKPDADVKAVETLLTEKLAERGDKREIVFDQTDNYLAMHTKKQEFPVKPDAARQAIFADALKTLGDSSIQLAFIPDADGRSKLLHSADDAPDRQKDIRPLLAKSSWMALAIDLGTSPQITASANAATESDAKAMSDGIKADLDDVKAQTTKPGPMILMAPLIQKVIDGLKITQAQTRVSVSINVESLKLIADFADSMGAFDER
ncbi:MAG TPA: hypothetical protein VFE47_06105 [Tepidisphaeraceae bacterium]|jgi:hypothetical protein|nr:hypothetical protein [Tepidisphaeraceae bacterium]